MILRTVAKEISVKFRVLTGRGLDTVQPLRYTRNLDPLPHNPTPIPNHFHRVQQHPLTVLLTVVLTLEKSRSQETSRPDPPAAPTRGSGVVDSTCDR